MGKRKGIINYPTKYHQCHLCHSDRLFILVDDGTVIRDNSVGGPNGGNCKFILELKEVKKLFPRHFNLPVVLSDDFVNIRTAAQMATLHEDLEREIVRAREMFK